MEWIILGLVVYIAVRQDLIERKWNRTLEGADAQHKDVMTFLRSIDKEVQTLQQWELNKESPYPR